jgi:hypothetical protein
VYILNIIIFKWNSYNVSSSNTEEVYGIIISKNIILFIKAIYNKILIIDNNFIK